MIVGEPDAVLETPPFRVPAEGRLRYRYVRVRTDFADDRWVEKAQVRSTGNDVVHHVLVFIIPKKGTRRRAALRRTHGRADFRFRTPSRAQEKA